MAEKKEMAEETEMEEEELEPLMRTPPPPPPWSKFFSRNDLRVICATCFKGNHHMRAPYCVQCDNDLETDVYRNFY